MFGCCLCSWWRGSSKTLVTHCCALGVQPKHTHHSTSTPKTSLDLCFLVVSSHATPSHPCKQTNTQSHISANIKKKKKKPQWDRAGGGTILFHISQEQITVPFPLSWISKPLSSSPRGTSSPLLLCHHHLWFCVIFLHYLFS